jgi:hypothetical protein
MSEIDDERRDDPNPAMTLIVGRLNEALEDAEDWFAAYNKTGVLVRVDLDPENKARLLFAKRGSRWGFVVEDERGGRVDLVHKGSIRHKLLASEKLEELRLAIDVAADERMRALQEATVRIQTFLRSQTQESP